jgi:hypothetical protein
MSIPAGERLLQLGLRQVELDCEESASLGQRVFLAISSDSKQREHQGLEIWNSHAPSLSAWRTLSPFACGERTC